MVKRTAGKANFNTGIPLLVELMQLDMRKTDLE